MVVTKPVVDAKFILTLVLGTIGIVTAGVAAVRTLEGRISKLETQAELRDKDIAKIAVSLEKLSRTGATEVLVEIGKLQTSVDNNKEMLVKMDNRMDNVDDFLRSLSR